MKTLLPTVALDCRVAGALIWDDNHALLGEDMLEVRLPNGVLVSCGWYPECDPTGAYFVQVTSGFQDIHSQTTNDACKAIRIVEDFSRLFSRDFSAVGESSGVMYSFPNPPVVALCA